MIQWLSDRMPPRDGATRMRRGSDVRVHLAHMARDRHLTPRRQAPQGMAADMLIARHHGKR